MICFCNNSLAFGTNAQGAVRTSSSSSGQDWFWTPSGGSSAPAGTFSSRTWVCGSNLGAKTAPSKSEPQHVGQALLGFRSAVVERLALVAGHRHTLGFPLCSVFGIDPFYLLTARFEQANDLAAFCLSDGTPNRRRLVFSPPHFKRASTSRLKSPTEGPAHHFDEAQRVSTIRSAKE
jgi:hypothetical protein